MSLSETLLSAKSLDVTYGAKRRLFGPADGGNKVLHGVDIDIRRGETVGIVGESGSGKTTLGRALLRLVDVSAGAIHFDGRDITHMPDAEMRPLRRRMQMIFQDPMASLNPRHTIRRILVEPLLLHGLETDRQAAERRVAMILERVTLPQTCLDRNPHELSGGQRQRIGIARAIAVKPRLIIADEATSALDVSLRSQMLDLMMKLQDEMGLSYVFISHDMSVIRYMCDRVAVMYRGKIVEAGETDQVVNNPAHDYTRALLSAIPNPDPRNRRIHNRFRYDEAAAGRPVSANG
jgi:ABC-type oligopeptide transport system ATPase subunit